MKRIAVLVSGSGSNLQALIDDAATQIKPNYQIGLVIASKPHIPAIQRAKAHGIAYKVIAAPTVPAQMQGEKLLAALHSQQIDLVVLAGYLAILPKQVIASYPQKIINIHPSLIPAFCGKGYYGMRVHRAVYQRGVKVTGATVHFVDEGIDSGQIIAQRVYHIHADDTAETIAQQVLKLEHQLLPEVVNALTKPACRD